MRFGSFCSGIEAATEAWAPLGWTCGYVAEIEPFPCHYLAQRHGASRPRYMPRPEDADTPADKRSRAQAIRKVADLPAETDLPNLGDVSQVSASELPAVDIIAAGFPCQDFSIAGLRNSLSGGRGNLSIIGMRLILEAADLGLVRGALLEQVPDVLNTQDNAWGNILGALVGADAALPGLDHGGRWPSSGMVAGPRSRVAWRILDAQYFGLAQRRERVWAVVDFGDGPDPAAVLFERQGLSRHPPTRRQAVQGAAGAADEGVEGGGGASGRTEVRGSGAAVGVPFGCDYDQEIGRPLVASQAGNRSDIETETVIVGALQANGKAAGSTTQQDAENGFLIPVASSEIAHALLAKVNASHRGDSDTYVAQMLPEGARPNGGYSHDDLPLVASTLRARDHSRGVDSDATDTLVAVAFSLRGREGGAMPEVEEDDVSPAIRAAEGGSTRPFVAFQTRGSNLGVEDDLTGTLGGNGGSASGAAPMVAFDETQITNPDNRSNPQPGDPCHPIPAHGRPPTLASTMAVRRITVVEAETLQGFPPNATLIRWPSAKRKGEDLAETIAYLIGHGLTPEQATEFAQTPDGPRYRAIGNSWPVPVAAWIGQRIAQVDALELSGAAA